MCFTEPIEFVVAFFLLSLVFIILSPTSDCLIREIHCLQSTLTRLLILGFKLVAASITACAFIGVSIGVGLIFGSLVYSISRNPAIVFELTRYSFIGFSLVESSGLIGLIMSFVSELNWICL